MFLLTLFSKLLLMLVLQLLFWEVLAAGLVTSILYLMCLFFLVSLLLMQMGLEYFGLIYLLVYVGAIMILFMFVILMLEISGLIVKKNNFNMFNMLFLYSVTSFFTLMAMDFSKTILIDNKFLFFKNIYWMNYMKQDSMMHYSDNKNFFNFAFFLYQKYSILVISIGFFLLVALFLSIIIILNKKPKSKQVYGDHQSHPLYIIMMYSMYKLFFL